MAGLTPSARADLLGRRRPASRARRRGRAARGAGCRRPACAVCRRPSRVRGRGGRGRLSALSGIAEGAELDEGAAQFLPPAAAAARRRAARAGWRSGRSGLPSAGRGDQRCRRRQDALDLDQGAAVADVAELPGGGVGQVDDALGMEGAAVVDAHHHRLAVGEVGDAHVAGNRQRRMRRGHGVHVVGLADGGLLAVELAAVPAGDAALLVRLTRGCSGT